MMSRNSSPLLWSLAAVILPVLATTAAAQTYNDEQASRARQAVRAILLAPDSAQFRDILVVAPAVCGSVSAVNLFGRRNVHRFVYHEGRAFIIVPAPFSESPTRDAPDITGEGSRIYRQFCM